MYNSGNSSKNVRGSAIVDGTVEAADLATAVNTDIADGVAGKATAELALPKTGGALTGAVTTNSTFDGRDVATDGAALDALDLAINSTANTVAVTIDANEYVGIGPVAPATILDVSGVNEVIRITDTTTSVGDATEIGTFEVYGSDASSGGAGIRTKMATYSDSASGLAYGLKFYTSLFNAAPVVGMTIDSSQNTTLAGSIKFNGDTAAANALDDYEEGTFTATLTSATPPTTPPTTTGTYTKIGNKVHFNINRFDNVDTSGASGQMQITGLPFTLQKEAIMTDISLYKFSFNTSRSQYFRFLGGDTMSAYESTSNTSWQAWSITAGTGRYLTVQGTYEAS